MSLENVAFHYDACRLLNHNLEAMAKQLYDYWFVQFDFPDENGKPYKSSGGKMVWNEVLKKYVPEGWEIASLRDIVDLEDSKRVPLSNAQRAGRKGNYPYYGATGIMDYIDDFIFDYDILLLAEDGSTSDANGFPVVQYVWGKVWVNNHAHIILPKDRDHLVYTYFLLKGIPIKLIETGSIQKKISQDNLLVYKTLNAPKYIRDIYTERMSALWEQKKLATEEIMQLTKQRDELLPLLMNGQVSVNYDLHSLQSWLFSLLWKQITKQLHNEEENYNRNFEYDVSCIDRRANEYVTVCTPKYFGVSSYVTLRE